MIKLIVFDIDGVLTDGMLQINANGEEQKRINLKDVDAIFELKRQGFLIGAITGEASAIVEYFKQKFPWDYFYSGKKDKKNTLQEIERLSDLLPEEICYVGDGKYDVEALAYVGLGICPQDAVDGAKDAADIILQRGGGQACLWEIVQILQNHGESKTAFVSIGCNLERQFILVKQLKAHPELMMNIIEMGELAAATYRSGNRVFLCADTGQEDAVQYIAAELTGQIYKKCYENDAQAVSIRTMVLSINGDCHDEEEVFERLGHNAEAGDLIIGISGTKITKSLHHILEHCKDGNLHIAVIIGRSFHMELNSLPECLVRIPEIGAANIREIYMAACHLLAEYVAEKLLHGGDNE